jgi:hypothetical protein
MASSLSMTSPRLTPIRKTILRLSGSSAFRHYMSLDFHGTLNRRHDTGKLGQDGVTGGVDHSTPVVLDVLGKQFPAFFQGTDRV